MEFEDSGIENVETGAISIFKVIGEFDSIQDRLTGMMVHGIFDSYILVPAEEFDHPPDLSRLERDLLNIRINELKK